MALGSSNDPAQERRRLRAAAAVMEHKQRWAIGGMGAAFGCVVMAHQLDELPETLRTAMLWIAPVIAVLSMIPFLRAACPQCKGRYHSLASLLRRPNEPLPCKSCGFHIDKHVSLYDTK